MVFENACMGQSGQYDIAPGADQQLRMCSEYQPLVQVTIVFLCRGSVYLRGLW